MKVLSVVGNRPQFIKSGPVSAALREAGIEEVGLHTGQHWDPDLSDVFYEELGLPEPDYRLDLHTADAETMRPPIAEVLAQERPDWTLVYGDTNSTRAGAEGAVIASSVRSAAGPETNRRSRDSGNSDCDAPPFLDDHFFVRTPNGASVMNARDPRRVGHWPSALCATAWARAFPAGSRSSAT